MCPPTAVPLSLDCIKATSWERDVSIQLSMAAIGLKAFITRDLALFMIILSTHFQNIPYVHIIGSTYHKRNKRLWALE